MANLIIKREKSMIGFALPMNCHINDCLIFSLKNGEEKSLDVADGIIQFQCNIPNNPKSKIIYLDLSTADSVCISIKQGSWKPKVTISDESLIVSKREIKDNNIVLKKQFSPSIVLKKQFSPSKVVGGYFGIDETSRQWAIGKGLIPSLKNAVPYSYDDIVDFELIEDGTSVIKGGLGSAAVGGVLFGGIGAIVGGVTGGKKAHQKCTSLMIKITVNNINAPTEYIKLITSPTDKKSIMYKSSFQNAQEIISLLQLICNESEDKKILETTNVSVNEVSVADEIRKFKALLDDGIITEEEFNAKKNQLLGL